MLPCSLDLTTTTLKPATQHLQGLFREQRPGLESRSSPRPLSRDVFMKSCELPQSQLLALECYVIHTCDYITGTLVSIASAAFQYFSWLKRVDVSEFLQPFNRIINLRVVLIVQEPRIELLIPVSLLGKSCVVTTHFVLRNLEG